MQMRRARSVFAGMAFLFGTCAAGNAQQILHATGPLPAYDVATIRKAAPDARNGITLQHYIQLAYNIPFSSTGRVLGGPSWLTADQYVIEGKASQALRDQMEKMTNSQRSDENRLMQQALLADRFHLKVHFETREQQVFELVPAKGGAKLTEVEPPAVPGKFTPPAANQPMTVATIAPGMTVSRMRGWTIELFGHAVSVEAFSNALLQHPEIGGRTIVDKTGLAARYDFTLQWTTAIPPRLNGDVLPPEPNPGPSLFTALEEQLGLRLIATKGPVEVVVIDHIDLPAEN